MKPLFERLDPQEECLWYGMQSKGPYMLDYLYFYIGSYNLATKRKFSEKYLGDLKNRWGIEKITSSAVDPLSHNFWYFDNYSKDIFLKLSDKVRLTKFLKSIKAYKHSVIVGSQPPDSNSKHWYVKSAHGFSGRGNFIYAKDVFEKISTQEFVVEEYLNRICDFAITFLDEENCIIYENQVNKTGKYQGTTIEEDTVYNIEKFLLKRSVPKSEIEHFLHTFSEIISFYKQQLNGKILIGSFDFFIYEKAGELWIHPCCEFNPRWTMGRVAWELSRNLPLKKLLFFQTVFSSEPIDGYEILSPQEDKIKFQVKWLS